MTERIDPPSPRETTPRTEAGRYLLRRLTRATMDIDNPVGRGWSVEEAIFAIEAEARAAAEPDLTARAGREGLRPTAIDFRCVEDVLGEWMELCTLDERGFSTAEADSVRKVAAFALSALAARPDPEPVAEADRDGPVSSAAEREPR